MHASQVVIDRVDLTDGRYRRSVIGVLSRGMRDNPVHRAVFGDDALHRRRCLERLFGAVTAELRHHEWLVAIRGRDIVAVAAAATSPCCVPTTAQKVRMVASLAPLGPRRLVRTRRWQRAWSRHDPADAHVHLGPVAVDSPFQGQGLGSRLLQTWNARLDDEAPPGSVSGRPSIVDRGVAPSSECSRPATADAPSRRSSRPRVGAAANRTEPPLGAERGSTVTPDDLERAVGDVLRDHYVFPDVGQELGALVQEVALDPNDPQRQWCETLTTALQTASGDRHIRLVEIEPGQRSPSADAATAGWRAEAERWNHGFTRVEWLAGGVGLVELRCFSEPAWATEHAAAAMTLLRGAESLIIDVRDNGGGSPEMVAEMIGYLIDEPTLLTVMHVRASEELEEHWARPRTREAHFGSTRPVWVLTSERTFSAGEQFAYVLQSLGRATLVGATTGGGAHPVSPFEVAEGIELRVPTGRPVDPRTGRNWEGVGVVPDVATAAEDALDRAYELACGRGDDRSPGARGCAAPRAGLEAPTGADYH